MPFDKDIMADFSQGRERQPLLYRTAEAPGLFLSDMQSARIQCVVVLYNCSLGESTTIRSLIDSCGHHDGFADQLSILIYDNSPAVQQFDSFEWPFGVTEYRHDSDNGGLAAAYNYALAMAQRLNIDWLLLLDQDTVLEGGLFSALLHEILAPPIDVCAMVPKLVQNGTMLSPQIIGRFRNNSIGPDFSGISSKPLTALNSAACLRVQTLVKIGGFPQEYWLDYLDHVVFHRLQAAGGHMLVLDVAIQHHLSSMNLETEMSIERYANMLSAERRFVEETGWGGGSLVHRVRLLKRAVSHFMKLRNRSYALLTLKSSLK